MPLARGIALTEATPKESRPQEGPMRIEDVPLHYAGQPARGRMAADGTNWCRCCDLSISTNVRAAFCAQHTRERNTQIARMRAANRPLVAYVPVETIDEILRIKTRLMTAIGEASAEFNAMTPPPRGTWIDSLMLVSKELARAAASLNAYVDATETGRPPEPPAVLTLR